MKHSPDLFDIAWAAAFLAVVVTFNGCSGIPADTKDALQPSFPSSGSTPTSLLGSATAYVVEGTTSMTVRGLPSTLTQIGVVWRGGGTSFDENVYNDVSYGRPSEYYIEASPDGSMWTALTHVTGNPYNGRQFVFGIAGGRYTQIRMRIVSIVGTYAGRVVLDVYNSGDNSADGYLFLGDSLTSDCWLVTDFPKEAFGPGIHAHRPNQYPMFSQGGTPFLMSESLLSTRPYGIPVIRQWLKDFPGKYVGISYGTNDANGDVPAATYCTNERRIVQEVIAAGKVPIIPTIVASPAAKVQANAPAMNACLAKLERQYPSIIKGPDLWTVFQGHSVADGWFSDHLHPSLTTGCTALKNAWINTMVSAIY